MQEEVGDVRISEGLKQCDLLCIYIVVEMLDVWGWGGYMTLLGNTFYVEKMSFVLSMLNLLISVIKLFYLINQVGRFCLVFMLFERQHTRRCGINISAIFLVFQWLYTKMGIRRNRFQLLRLIGYQKEQQQLQVVFQISVIFLQNVKLLQNTLF
eukprot:TRINITY_DN2128_c0_g1_i2.p5 TRINITY_DN2128_c0_g1~~TRINITY_DN2128_c0_g1_i2.p5  ORF type:complete len:154 (+),score=10.07 TRINITY_DN2128_c0_g1_i2:2697-3158(+)